MTTRPTNDAATKRQAKASVREAIGKLIGDDAARDHGATEKKAAAPDASDDKGSPHR